MFKDYPDVMSVQQAAEALGICTASMYQLLREKTIGSRKVGRKILVPKVCLIDYINSARYLNSNL